MELLEDIKKYEILKDVNEPYETVDDDTFLGLTDDQKAVEQSKQSDYYQEILEDSDSHDYSSVGEEAAWDGFDGYEYIDEKDDTKYDDNVCDTTLEWRVLSRLDGETGDDWRIVSDLNSMPRRSKWDKTTKMNEHEEISQKLKKINVSGSNKSHRSQEPQNFKIKSFTQENKNVGTESDYTSEQPISAKQFLEKLLSNNRTNYFPALLPPPPPPPPDTEQAGWLRKQVTFGE